tara:strand:- start:1650 stop:2372 length:723 start_codon:yes stop_codon:yes gene_type:complete
MKKQILLFVILISSLSVNAQWFTKEAVQNHQSVDKKPLSWGYYIGFNNLDFKFDYKTPVKDIVTEKSTGFNVGLIGNARITDHVDIRLEPGLVISTRTLFFDESYFEGIPEDDIKNGDFMREVKSTYVYVPLLLKLSTTRINNFRPFILAGLSTAINLSSNEDNPEDNSSGNYRTKTNVSFYEVGFGVDFYLSYFKFTPSIRGVFATNNELVPDVDPNSPWTGNIESQQTRGIFINFTFQ